MPMSKRVELDPIVRRPFYQGAYHINIHSADVLDRAPLMRVPVLCVGGNDNQITLKKPYHPLADLPKLLKAIGKKNLWGQDVPCWVYYLTLDGVIDPSSKSTTRALSAPVRPYQGLLSPSALGSSLPKLTYLFPPKGRRLLNCADAPEMRSWPGLDFGGLYFMDSAGYLETAPANRGFDCWSFILALYRVNPGYNVDVSTGASLAQRIGCTNWSIATGTWSAIKSLITGWGGGFEGGGGAGALLLWTNTRAHFLYSQPAGVSICGLNPTGYFETPFDAWVPESPATVYNVQKAPRPLMLLPKPGWSPINSWTQI